MLPRCYSIVIDSFGTIESFPHNAPHNRAIVYTGSWLLSWNADSWQGKSPSAYISAIYSKLAVIKGEWFWSAVTVSPTEALSARWRLDKADWSTFKSTIEEHMANNPPPQDNQPLEEKNDYITNTINKAATKSIPRSTPGPRRQNAWYYSDAMKVTKNEVNYRLKHHKQAPTETTKAKLTEAINVHRKTCQEAKTQSWIKWTETLNEQTNSKVLWQRIKWLAVAGLLPLVTPIQQLKLRNCAKRSPTAPAQTTSQIAYVINLKLSQTFNTNRQQTPSTKNTQLILRSPCKNSTQQQHTDKTPALAMIKSHSQWSATLQMFLNHSFSE